MSAQSAPGTTRKRRKTCSIGTSFPRCGNLEQDGSRFHSRTPLISVSLERGITALSGKYALEKLKKENGEFHTKVIDLFEYGEAAFVAAYSGMATFAAINTILYDTNFDLVGESEKGVPPDDWDASYYGSLAVSGSAVWEGKGGIEGRADYWRWYLDDAIPQAWDVVSQLKIN
ncbi:hypothetical protein CIG66_22735 (plasmid) [Ralstonia pseudosolanacearum]|nr:hypothetical protein CIG66_22735 [Ralstonia pseudosolanacearum]